MFDIQIEYQHINAVNCIIKNLFSKSFQFLYMVGHTEIHDS